MTITQIYTELEAAQREFETRAKEEVYARNNTTTALNKLNNAQKALDAFLNDLKKAAPHQREWKRSKGVAITE